MPRCSFCRQDRRIHCNTTKGPMCQACYHRHWCSLCGTRKPAWNTSPCWACRQAAKLSSQWENSRDPKPPNREARIALFTERALQRQPLFGGVA